MPSASTTTLIKMLESLPEPLQERVLEHVQDYIVDLKDELKWNDAFAGSQDKLVAAARQAREEIAHGKATPLDLEEL